jgi:hypothetical protein
VLDHIEAEGALDGRQGVQGIGGKYRLVTGTLQDGFFGNKRADIHGDHGLVARFLYVQPRAAVGAVFMLWMEVNARHLRKQCRGADSGDQFVRVALE